MQPASKSGNRVLFVVLLLVGMVTSDFEYVCHSRRMSEITNRCGVLLMEMVYVMCNGDPVDLHYDSSDRESGSVDQIFINADRANSLLSFPVGHGNAGITCECCHYRCTADELSQYCHPQPLARARRSTSKKSLQTYKKRFTTSDVDNIYDSIRMSENTLKGDKVLLSKFEKHNVIKTWKLENIESRLLTKYIDESSAEEGPRSPPVKVTTQSSYERLGNTLKPKLASEVNRSAKHRHSRKHLFRKNEDI